VGSMMTPAVVQQLVEETPPDQLGQLQMILQEVEEQRARDAAELQNRAWWSEQGWGGGAEEEVGGGPGAEVEEPLTEAEQAVFEEMQEPVFTPDNFIRWVQ
jgi:hypothetical protein